MSIAPNLALLDMLNRGKTPLLRDWLCRQLAPVQISWYPYAGSDFHDLVYFSKRYLERIHIAKELRDTAPQLFIHTDAGVRIKGDLCDALNLLPIWTPEDGRTKVSLLDMEHLARLPIPLITEEEKGRTLGVSPQYGQALFFKLRIQSDKLGDFEQHVVYCFVENRVFLERMLRPSQSQVRWIYTAGIGGPDGAASWLRGAIDELHAKVVRGNASFVSDFGDAWQHPLYPDGSKMTEWFIRAAN